MHRGWVYVLLSAFPALLVAGIAAVALFGAAAGALWLFAFGDKPRPQAAETALGVGFGAAWLSLWLALLAALGVTVGAAGVIVLHQWSVGNMGPVSDSERCSNFCDRKGFPGSSMPPRMTGLATCSCVDAQGREALTAPLAETGR